MYKEPFHFKLQGIFPGPVRFFFFFLSRVHIIINKATEPYNSLYNSQIINGLLYIVQLYISVGILNGDR